MSGSAIRPNASPQARASDPLASVFVAANAGSGKTSTLVTRVARLLLQGVSPQAVLCVTYTKAAASEMQRRLFAQLGGWAVLGDAALREALERIGESPRDLGQARRLFARALETPGGLKIQTLHGFCDALLHRFPLEAGVSPGFRVLEDTAAHEVAAQAREALALAALQDEDGPIGRAYAHLAVALDPRAFEALLASFERDREKVLDYAERGGIEADVWRRCGFEGAPGDADALEQAAVLACDWGQWLRAAEALRGTGMASDAKLADRLHAVARGACGPFDDCFGVFSTQAGAPTKDLGTRKLDAQTRAWLQAEQARLHGVCETARAARQAHDTVEALTLALAHARFYEEAKAARGGLDFADLTARAVELLTVRADAAWVLYKLDGGIDHLLLDEAQDTSPRQWALLRALAEEFFAGEGARAAAGAAGPRTVFVVGDQKQSIYSFQGAAPERLRAETEAYAALAADAGARLERVPLIESWRSTPQILAFVDAVFADPATQGGVAPAPDEPRVRHAVSAPRAGHAGAVDLWPLLEDQAQETGDAWDAPLDAPSAGDARRRLARAIAESVAAMIARGEAVFESGGGGGGWRRVRPGDVLILVRRRDALFEEIIRALKAADVPVAGPDRLRLSEHIVFSDVLALVRFTLFPWDDLTLAALLRSPFCDVDEGGLYALAQPRGEDRNLWAELNRRGDERPEWDAARGFLGWARAEAAVRGPFDFIGRVLGHLDAARRTMRQRLVTRLGPEAEDAIEAMLGEALAAEARGLTDLERFATALARADVTIKRETEGDGGGAGPDARRHVGQVRVMTVHGAKGLEAPVVILPDTTGRPPRAEPGLLTADDGLLFSTRAADDTPAARDARAQRKARDDQEGLRLLYVAMTRARDRLIVCGRLAANTKAPPPDSWYTRIATAFVRPEIESRAVRTGALEIRRFGADPALLATEAAGGPVAPAPPDWLTRLAPRSPEASRYASPSTYAERERGAAPSPLAATGGLGRFRRGELIHRLFQLLPDLAASERADAAARWLARERDLTPEQRREMTDAALGVLADPRFAEVFGPGSRAEAAVAGTAADLPPGLAISGRVDRMVVGADRVLVVDFKTNRPSPDRIDTADPAYLVQMSLYVAVLRAVFPGRRVDAALVWTDGPKLMPVPESLVASTLAGLRRAG